jgi:hypothetical protein
MTLHFGYGSNMSRALMGARCPGATPLGPATLHGWRFIVGADGYASMVRRPGGIIYGVLWHLTPRDLVAVNAYERVDDGLYLRRIVPVRHGVSACPGKVGAGFPRRICANAKNAERIPVPAIGMRSGLVPALAYILRRRGEGRPRPAYIDLVEAAAREWALPESYISGLRRWSPWRSIGTRARDIGEIG